MTALIAHRLRLTCVATSPMLLPLVRGPVIRGALVQALLAEFCPVAGADACGSAHFAGMCPVCSLLATGEDAAQHGNEAPRPFTIEPPLGSNGTLAAGDPFEFGLTLVGDAVSLLPYVIAGLTRMGNRGIGDRGAAPGRFRVREVWAVEPMRGYQHRLVTEGEPTIIMPDLPITHDAVLERVSRLPINRVTLDLLTPLRLVVDGQLVHRLTFGALARR